MLSTFDYFSTFYERRKKLKHQLNDQEQKVKFLNIQIRTIYYFKNCEIKHKRMERWFICSPVSSFGSAISVLCSSKSWSSVPPLPPKRVLLLCLFLFSSFGFAPILYTWMFLTKQGGHMIRSRPWTSLGPCLRHQSYSRSETNEACAEISIVVFFLILFPPLHPHPPD